MFGQSTSPIEVLKAAVVDDKSRLTTVLRRAKVQTAALQNEPLKAWLNNELNGYRDEMSLPEYRVFSSVQIFGNFSGPFGSGVQNMVLPTSQLPDHLAKFSEVRLLQSVRELEELAGQGPGMRRRLPAEFAMMAREYIEMANGMVLVDAWQPMASYILEGVLDAVRNRLLDFLLELEQVDPGIFSSPTPSELINPERITQIFNYTINGSNNVVASGNEVTQSVSMSIAQGDKNALTKQLSNLGIPESESGLLIEAIEADGSQQGRELGAQTKSWFGKATQKIAEGAWKTTTTAAPTIITKLLGQYFGWDG